MTYRKGTGSPQASPAPRADGRPLRVALIARSGELYGAERSLFRLALGFAQWPEFQPLVIVPGEGLLRQRCRDYGIDTALVDHRPWQGGRRHRFARLRRHVDNLRAWPRLLRRLVRFGPDVVLSSTATVTVGALAARRLGVAHVWRLQETRFAEQRPPFDLGWRLTLGLLKSRNNHLVGASSAVRDYFQGLLARDDVTTVYEGFDFPPVPETIGRDFSQGGAARPPVTELLCLGSLLPGKGCEDAVRAVADLVQGGLRVHLRIVGEGDPAYIEGLRALARGQHVDACVSLSGFTGETAALFRRAAITLVCGRYEGFGRSAVESLSHGIPVIAADAGGLPEIVKPGRTGLLYPAGDWRTLSDRIRTLIGDDELYTQIATTGVAWARQRFPARRFIREMGAVLTAAALERNPGLRAELADVVRPLPEAVSLSGMS